LLRLLLRRQDAASVARLASADAGDKWSRLAGARRGISGLLLRPAGDPARRDRELERLEAEQAELERGLAMLLPELEEHKQLARLGPKALAAALPPRSAFVDILSYARYEKNMFAGWRYLAFVVSVGPRVDRVELGDARAIDGAVLSWRKSIAR